MTKIPPKGLVRGTIWAEVVPHGVDISVELRSLNPIDPAVALTHALCTLRRMAQEHKVDFDEAVVDSEQLHQEQR